MRGKNNYEDDLFYKQRLTESIQKCSPTDWTYGQNRVAACQL